MDLESKNCPFCDEQIKPKAVKYRHCGEFLQRETPEKSKFEKRMDRMEERGKKMNEIGKGLMPLTYAGIIIIILVYMCS